MKRQKTFKFTDRAIWLIPAVAAVLVPVCVLVTGVKSSAADIFAIIDQMRGTPRVIRDGIGRSEEAKKGKTILRSYDDILVVPPDDNSWADLDFRYSNNQKTGFYFTAGPHAQWESQYKFPCRGNAGELQIQWTYGNNTQPCQNVTVRATSDSSPAQSPHLQNTYTVQAAKNILKAKNSSEMTVEPASAQDTKVKITDIGNGELKVTASTGNVLVNGIPLQQGATGIFPRDFVPPPRDSSPR
ncbi:hypothetical protein [Microseira wollei]|uniref:Uncharacterized protein n=1 Tax=Microseira wollei NIES-4236 TaxID=2530354 RepID=A0AAV3XGV3_9CYAN|nr:hypothetical protein [Microseira wollei]GET41843.1 hypothetical protein MiSe_66570 [Microseira wollei NIES-4236]